MKDYKVKAIIPCEYHVQAETKSEAKKAVLHEIYMVSMNAIDCSGEQGYEQLHSEAAIKEITECERG